MNLKSKYLFILILALLLCVSCTQSAAEHTTPIPTTQMPHTDKPTESIATVKLVPDKINAPVGEIISISIIVENVKNLYGVELHFSYNTDTWEAIDAVPQQEGIQILPGSFLKPDFIARNEAKPEVKSISYAAVQLPPNEAVSGSGVIASLRFKIKANDENPLTLEQALLADQDGAPIPAKIEKFHN